MFKYILKHSLSKLQYNKETTVLDFRLKIVIKCKLKPFLTSRNPEKL